jgi:hypothetical protein
MVLRRLLFAVALLASLSASARAENLFALLNNDPAIGQRLVSFDSQTRAVTSTVVLQTVNTLSPLSSIDFRPSTGQLYGYDAGQRQLYTINTSTGALTAIGAALPAASGQEIDFNPTVDLIRLVGNGGQNLRLNPNTGAIAGTDTNLAYSPGDPNEGDAPNVRAAGYTNSVSGAVTTTLYDIDVDNDVLVTQTPANSGLLQTVGPLGVDLNAGLFGTFVGFDISGATGIAYLTNGAFAGPSDLYSVNLATGAATSLGEILGLPAGRTVASIAVAPVPEPSTILMAGIAAFGLAAYGWRRKKAA